MNSAFRMDLDMEKLRGVAKTIYTSPEEAFPEPELFDIRAVTCKSAHETLTADAVMEWGPGANMRTQGKTARSAAFDSEEMHDLCVTVSEQPLEATPFERRPSEIGGLYMAQFPLPKASMKRPV